MNKREFLTHSAASLAGTLAALSATPASAAPSTASRAQTILTISGAIERHNRGAIDPVSDQMLYKQGVRFEQAFSLDFNEITSRLPAREIQATVEYDMKKHRLAGPLLTDLLTLAGAKQKDNAHVKLRALDGYTVAPTFAELRRYEYIATTHLDSAPHAIGGLGPLFVMYDVDRYPDMLARPVEGRYTYCSWGLCHVEIMSA